MGTKVDLTREKGIEGREERKVLGWRGKEIEQEEEDAEVKGH